ncbi:MAG: tetratricopeptide repeat protein [Candidatus Melainabacteria bacterium]|nr:tetratricopeptide repeat protein [Candidatus Melainabacteria bacterium]
MNLNFSLSAQRLTLLICLLLTAENAAAQNVNFTARKTANRAYDNLVKQATHALDNGDYLNAINLWTKIISDFPNKSEPFLQRAVVRRQIGDLKGAQLDLDKALELSPNLAPALIQRAAVRHRLLDMKGAQADVERAVELAPNNYQAYAERGSIRYALGDLQGALADYNTAMTINPEMGKRLNKAVQPQVGQNWQAAPGQQTWSNQQTTQSQQTAQNQQIEANQAPQINQAGSQVNQGSSQVHQGGSQTNQGSSQVHQGGSQTNQGSSQVQTAWQNQLPPGVTVQSTNPGQLSVAGPKLQANFQLATSSALGLKELFARGPATGGNSSGQGTNAGQNSSAGLGNSSGPGSTTTGNTLNSSTTSGSTTSGSTSISSSNTGSTSTGNTTTGNTTANGNSGSNSRANAVTLATANGAASSASEPELPTYSASQLAHLNNLAASAINNKQFDKAIDILERLVKASPDYAHARDNLVIAHNNLGLQQAARKPEQAVNEFRAALFIDSSKMATRKNLNAVLSELGKEPNNHQDRRKLAETLMDRGDWQGAYVEITEALRLNNNRESRLLLAKVITAMESAPTPAAVAPVMVSTRAAKPRRSASEIAAAAAARASEPPLQSPSAGPAFYPSTAVVPKETIARETITREPTATQPIATQPTPTQPTAKTPETAAALDTVATQADAFRQETPESTVPHVKAFDQDFMNERIKSSPEDVLMVARQFATEGNYLDAEALLVRLIESQSASIGNSTRKTDLLEVALESLISIYIKLNKPDRAEQHLKALLQLQEISKHPHDPQLGKTMADYARVLRINGKQDEAAKHQAKADSILDRLSGTAP